MAVLSGCQGKPQLKILDKTCPNCGAEIEMFSIDTEARCEKCGFGKMLRSRVSYHVFP